MNRHGPLLEVSTGLGIPLREILALAEQTDLRGVEYMSGLRDMVRDPEEVISLSQEYGVPVTSIHEPLWLIAYTPQLLFQRLLAVARRFPKANTYVIHLSSVLNYLQQGPEKVLKLAELARQNGFVLAVESNTVSPILRWYPAATCCPEAFAAFCIRHGLKMTLDTSHITAYGADIVAFYEKHYEHIAMIHLSDYKDGVEHLPLGTGNLPLKELFAALKRTHYEGTICLELEFPDVHDTSEKLRRLARSIQFARQYLA